MKLKKNKGLIIFAFLTSCLPGGSEKVDMTEIENLFKVRINKECEMRSIKYDGPDQMVLAKCNCNDYPFESKLQGRLVSQAEVEPIAMPELVSWNTLHEDILPPARIYKFDSVVYRTSQKDLFRILTIERGNDWIAYLHFSQAPNKNYINLENQ